MNERTTVRLPASLLAKAKQKAAAEGRTLTSLIEEGLWKVTTQPPSQRRPRLPIPVSDATGPPFPGIDISNSAALQEMDDLEYVERMKHFK